MPHEVTEALQGSFEGIWAATWQNVQNGEMLNTPLGIPLKIRYGGNILNDRGEIFVRMEGIQDGSGFHSWVLYGLLSADGRVWEGRWWSNPWSGNWLTNEPDGDAAADARGGEFVFTLADDGQTFTGVWNLLSSPTNWAAWDSFKVCEREKCVTPIEGNSAPRTGTISVSAPVERRFQFGHRN
jgi:hypothetical protein